MLLRAEDRDPALVGACQAPRDRPPPGCCRYRHHRSAGRTRPRRSSSFASAGSACPATATRDRCPAMPPAAWWSSSPASGHTQRRPSESTCRRAGNWRRVPRARCPGTRIQRLHRHPGALDRDIVDRTPARARHIAQQLPLVVELLRHAEDEVSGSVICASASPSGSTAWLVEVMSPLSFCLSFER